MKKIKLTEVQLGRIVKKIVTEQESEKTPDEIALDKVRGKEFEGIGRSPDMNMARSMARTKVLQQIMKEMGLNKFTFTYKNLEEVGPVDTKQEVLSRKERKSGKRANYIVTRTFKVI